MGDRREEVRGCSPLGFAIEFQSLVENGRFLGTFQEWAGQIRLDERTAHEAELELDRLHQEMR